ncbi:hypothetical protein GQX74_014625 [Glossina fuscipes]|nr:hypothetical protein GQX74_014625 [Glossina fuscipes]
MKGGQKTENSPPNIIRREKIVRFLLIHNNEVTAYNEDNRLLAHWLTCQGFDITIVTGLGKNKLLCGKTTGYLFIVTMRWVGHGLIYALGYLGMWQFYLWQGVEMVEIETYSEVQKE